ncbi:MAG: hypothetical protein MK008_12450, partial [Bdellovibrionales bacterium]|nr:hypothetical protein [Bdellovibrionales bacterium]
MFSILLMSFIVHGQSLQPFCENQNLSSVNNQALEAAYNCDPKNYLRAVQAGADVLSQDCNGSD